MDWLKPESVILDFGLGFNADFSIGMIQRIGLTAIGFDPTRRHEPALRQLEREHAPRFQFRSVALGPKRGTVQFHESTENVSGSMLEGHCNVRSDTIKSYDVPVITLQDAIDMTQAKKVDLVKIDVEGIEYDVVEAASDALLRSVPQWIVEYHHDCVVGIPVSRTRSHLRRFRSLGFSTHSVDSVNFLFFQARR